MPALISLLPGTRFRQPELGLTGTLLKVNECRALVRIDQPQQLVEFTGPDGAIRTFQARRQTETSWAPTVVVEALSISRPDERDIAMTTTKKKIDAAKKTPAGKKTKAGSETSSKPRKPAKAKPEGKLSQLDAAAKVLAEADGPMTTKGMVEVMASKGYWSSPNGQTPAQTLYAAILREINTKGSESRFQKADKGLFTLNGNAEPKPTAKKAAKSTKPADGTPGPKAVSELFNV